ncbi:MAG: transglycosylase domain-containing protein, partial [Bacteroidota bacterium]
MILLLTSFGAILPDPLFNDPTSTVLFDRQGELLGARIAEDGQWRFPQADSLPDKFIHCIINFEDRYYFKHPGFNPLSLVRAFFQNLKAGEIISGGSTITMQVIRLSRKNKSRTLKEKVIELLLALKLEFRHSKKEILSFYASYAPFGGNVVGLETAAWRYFDASPFHLSWAESAFLAVLPNAPSLMHPGKNRDVLLEKRNRLLLKLRKRNILSDIDYQLALSESLPEAPKDLPAKAYHLTERFNQSQKGRRISSTINKDLQEKVDDIIQRSKSRLYAMGIHNAACLVTKVDGGEVLAYVGNIRNSEHPEYGGDVDVIPSSRSSGSILKPLLYTMMQYRGELLPHTLVGDIPTRYGNYSPKNYKKGYDGIVKASEALARSLNVPAVRMLHQYGNERFLNDLRNMGMSTLNKPGDHYGLSIILGGAESSLEDLSSIYTSMARVLNHYNEKGGVYFRPDWKKVEYQNKAGKNPDPESSPGEEQGL